jgi:hypothetical protein
MREIYRICDRERKKMRERDKENVRDGIREIWTKRKVR